MDSTIESLVGQSATLFSARLTLTSLWQDIAENFYSERADFTIKREIGTEFNDWNLTSYPNLARRDLGDSIGSMLRPDETPWFRITTTREESLDHESKLWLEEATLRQRRAMYDPLSQFTRATKEGDHDWAAFGQCVLETGLNRNDPRLIYQSWHLRDVVWTEDQYRAIDRVDRRWKPTISMAMRMFGKNNSNLVIDKANDHPNQTVDYLKIVMRSDQYKKGQKNRFPWVCLWIDAGNHHLIEETGLPENPYTIPRWKTVSGSQYAYSAATVIALPDARMIQSMTRVLLEAGEKAVDPPMIAVAEAIRSDYALYAGGVTMVEAEYNEKLGEVLRPITQSTHNFNYGLELAAQTREMISEAFYLNALSLPPAGDATMTAYETGQRVQEYIRRASPLFRPLTADYNGDICNKTFNLSFRNGLFGRVQDIPDSLQGANIEFRFESPLHDAIEQQKGQKFLEGASLLETAMQIDPGVAANIDTNYSFRDAFAGIGSPERWLVSEEVAQERQQQAAEKEQEQEVLDAASQAGNAAKDITQAAQTEAQTEAVT